MKNRRHSDQTNSNFGWAGSALAGRKFYLETGAASVNNLPTTIDHIPSRKVQSKQKSPARRG